MQIFQNKTHRSIDIIFLGVDDDLGMCRGLISCRNARKLINAFGLRFFIKPFRIAPDAFPDIAFYEHLDKIAFFHVGPDGVAVFPVRGHERHYRDEAVLGSQLCDLADPSYILFSVPP